MDDPVGQNRSLRFNVACICKTKCLLMPITVAARSEAWTLFASSNTAIVGSNPTEGIDVCVVCVYSVCVLCAGRGLEIGWSPSKETYRMCIGSRNWKSGWGATKGCRVIIILIIIKMPTNKMTFFAVGISCNTPTVEYNVSLCNSYV
jgi:hypothetical protein